MSDDGPNISRLKEMAIRGEEYREEYVLDYFGEELVLYLKALPDDDLIPIFAILEAKTDIDYDEATDKLEDEVEGEGGIDPSAFDEETINAFKRVVLEGVDRTRGDAEGASRQDMKEIVGLADNEEDNINLRGGATLEIAYKILEISGDAEDAEKFRRDGGR